MRFGISVLSILPTNSLEPAPTANTGTYPAVWPIRRIKGLDLSLKPNLDYARDMFLFCFYTRGMSFIDMAYLRKKDLHVCENTRDLMEHVRSRSYDLLITDLKMPRTNGFEVLKLLKFDQVPEYICQMTEASFKEYQKYLGNKD